MHASDIDLAHCRQLRAVLRSYQNAIVKALPRPVFQQATRHLGVLRGNRLTFESESELATMVTGAAIGEGTTSRIEYR